MVKIRLARIGRHMDPSYRIVVADSRCPRDGRCIEQIGHYDPMLAPEKAVLNALNNVCKDRTVISISHRVTAKTGRIIPVESNV